VRESSVTTKRRKDEVIKQCGSNIRREEEEERGTLSKTKKKADRFTSTACVISFLGGRKRRTLGRRGKFSVPSGRFDLVAHTGRKGRKRKST